MNVQKEEIMEDSLERLMGGEVGEVSPRVLKIVTNKCLLREKDNILNLLKRERVCKKIGIY